MPRSDPRKPVIEDPPHGETSADGSDRALRLRIRQQEILAGLGVKALKGTPFPELLNEVCPAGNETMRRLRRYFEPTRSIQASPRAAVRNRGARMPKYASGIELDIF